MVGHVTIEPQLTEPAVCRVEVNLLADSINVSIGAFKRRFASATPQKQF
jgi:hypothetical protein